MKKLLLLPLLLFACSKEPLQSEIEHPCGYDMTSYYEVNTNVSFTEKFPNYNEPTSFDCEQGIYVYVDEHKDSYLLIEVNDTFIIGYLKFIN